MNKISFAFFGSAYFSAVLLEKIINDEELKKHIDLKFVVTQPDKPSGRKRIMTPTPVKLMADKYGIQTYVEMNDDLSNKLREVDLVLLYAYGAIIKNEMLNIPRYGFWNIHPSLLPLYRGTAPMATPLINGDENTGVTIIKMDDKIDHGPIIDQTMYTMEKDDKKPELETKLTSLGFESFKSQILKGVDKIEFKEQDHEMATYTKKLKKDDGFIEFESLKKKLDSTPVELHNLFRGLYPWPGIWTILPDNKRLKITYMEFEDNKLVIKKVQLEGKNEVDFKTFNSHYQIF